MTESNVKRGKRRTVMTDVVELYDGDCIVYRTKRSGRVYQFRMWVQEQKRYVRKSCKTKNLENGISVGKEYYWDIKTKLRNKQNVFNKTFGEIVEEFLEEQKNTIGVTKTQKRYDCVKGMTKHILGFVGGKTYITDVDEDRWKDYYNYRRKKKKTLVNTTLLNEKYTIGNFYKFCVDKRYLQNFVPKFVKIDSDSRRREHFTEEQWRTIYTFFRTNEWLQTGDKKLNEERKFIRDFSIVSINTGIRKNELRNVRWENVSVEKNGDKEESKLGVRIKLDKTQTKTKKSRTVIGRRGDVFNRIRSYSKHTKMTDYVFVDKDTGEQIKDNKYYVHWDFLIKSIGFDKIRRDNGFYCLRHSYCTWRLMRGVDILSLSKSMGTSIGMIQKHYEHILLEMKGHDLVKDLDLTDTEMLIFD